MSANKINPGKLLNSKWTAVNPENKERHFIVTNVKFDEKGELINCIIEAVINRRATSIQWWDLKDNSRWIQGWQ